MPRDISKNMRAVKSSGSEIERRLGRSLWKAGLRYRKDNRKIFGKPDFTLRGFRIAIFADSEFWHGKNWRVRKLEHKSNIEFWHRKIEANIKRDQLVNRTLRRDGWIVLRFWGNSIIKTVDICVAKVAAVVVERLQNESINIPPGQ